MKRIIKITAVLAALGVSGLEAQNVGSGSTLTANPDLPTTRVGTRGATFLQLGVGARALALGGAYTALADDVSALYWNSAGIGHLEGFAAGYSSSMLYADADITHTFVGVVLPAGMTRFGISVNMLNSGDMAWTNADFPNSASGGDMDPSRTDFEWTSMAIGGHVARPVTDRLMVGGALKYVTEGINNASATFIGADIGASFRTGLYGVTLGASLQNIGSSSEMEGSELISRVNTSNSESQTDFNRIIEFRSRTAEVEMPTLFRFSVVADLMGTATSLLSPNPNSSLKLVADLSDAIDTDLQSGVGIEFGFRDFAFLRAGKKWTNEAQIETDFAHHASIGGGVRLPLGSIGDAVLDYAYMGMGDLDNVQVFSVQLQF